MDSTLLNLFNESKITKFGVRTKMLRSCEVKGGFSKTPHATPLKLCAFLVYLMDFNHSNLNIDIFYSLSFP